MTNRPDPGSSSDNDDLDPSLLEAYWLGDASANELAHVSEWLDAHPERRAYYDKLYRGIATGDWRDLSATEITRRRDSILCATGVTAQSPMDARRRPTIARVAISRARRHVVFAVGAVFAGLIAVIGFTRVSNHAVESGATESVATYTTKPGQRATVTLPDGSRMTMAPGTTVSLAGGYGTNARTVTLDGEAYFVVAHSANAVFRVRTSAADTRVLGTTFVIRKYSNERTARVVVVDGKVLVRATHAPVNDARFASVVLSASRMAMVSDSGVIAQEAGTVMEQYTGWIDGRLIFRDTPLREAVTELARTYGVDIAIADSVLGNRPVTLTAQTNVRSLADILDVLAPIVNAHYTRDRHGITLRLGRRVAPQVRTAFPLTLEKQNGR